MSADANVDRSATGRGADLLPDRESFEFALDAHLLTDAHGLVLDVNPVAAQLFLTPREFLVGKPLGLLVTPEDRPAFYACLGRLPAGESAHTLELRVNRRGADPRDVVAVAGAVGPAAGGRPAAYRWVFRDVTGARRTERELQWERQVLEGVVDAADAAILVVDRAGRVVRSNAYLHDVSGYTADELKGRDWGYALLAPADRAAGRRIVAQALSHGTGQSGPLDFQPGGRGGRTVVWSARGLAAAEPTVVLVGHDVTELQEARDQAVRAERLAAIGQVAAGLAHESRNALQRSQACLSLLGLRLADRPDVRDLLDRAQKAQDDLHRLYEGVLHYATPLKLEPTDCDLGGVWREAWADLAGDPRWGAAEVVEAGTGADARCVADAFHMRQVFRSLFENARAAVAGPLRVVVRWAGVEHAGRPALRVGVRDNGPGFPPAARGRLFQAFVTTKTHGTGLGLAQCKRVVEEHGGRIEAGPAGPGAEVVITLLRSTS